jgi:hypothetical protein|tara:strand:- start:2018 stop:2332 length:315 start_codon:yes stop_codon:yes gene_type:complete
MENLPAIPEEDSERTVFWTQHVEAWHQSAFSQREYARQHQLPIARFTYWKNKLYPNPRESGFVQVNLEASASVRIHHPTGTVIECLAGTDVGWLRSLLGMMHAS